MRYGNEQVYATLTPAKCVSPQKNSIENSFLQSLTTTERLYTFAPPTKETAPMSTDPHQNEYLAAIAALHEHTPSPRTYAVGDYVSGVSGGKAWSGRIDWFFDNGDVCVNVGGAWLVTPTSDITF